MKKIIAANWKQNGNLKLLIKLTRDICVGISKLKKKPNIILLPPSLYIQSISTELKNKQYSKFIKIGSQNISAYENGAYTGEISVNMTKDFDCPYILIGHSERRNIFMESDALISRKLNESLKKNKKIILCVGEKLQEYKDNHTKRVITKQIKTAFKDSINLIKRNKKNLIIAYEPVWAIGTGKSAKDKDIEKTHALIKNLISKLINDPKSEIKILYGGSVSPKNSYEILHINNVDGALVGGASLSSKKFIEICRSI
tara:strand:- start:229 stop:999 length:771 start_codon:yes stop_codon:yes gene_type:complete